MRYKNHFDDIQINKKHWDEMAKRDNPTRAKFLRMIRDNYPRRFVRNLVWTVTLILLAVWAIVGYSAAGKRGASVVVISEIAFGLLTILFWKWGKGASAKNADD